MAVQAEGKMIWVCFISVEALHALEEIGVLKSATPTHLKHTQIILLQAVE